MTEAQKFFDSLLTFGVRPGLDNIKILMSRLGNVQDKLKFIHVAGTNGKGSVCTFLSYILREYGLTVGLYTSPYITRFGERIRVNGEPIDDESLEIVGEKVKKEVLSLRAEGTVITEFEAVTAAAFLYFYEKKCDIVVLETGLGGRFDATNIIQTPLCEVITSISLDHMAVLGDTLEKIAFEKAGIIKTNTCVFTSSNQEKSVAETIKKQAEKMNAEFFSVDDSVYTLRHADIHGTRVFDGKDEYFISFPGRIQIENFSLAVAVLRKLDEISFIKYDAAKVNSGMKKAVNPARCEIVREKPLVIMDGCHNIGSATALVDIVKSCLKDKKIRAVVGMMADKQTREVTKKLSEIVDEVICVKPTNPRSLDAASLAARFSDAGVKIVSTSGIDDESIVRIVNETKSDEILLVCGSLYLCSDLREKLINI